MKGNLFCAIIFFILPFCVFNVLMAAVPTFNSVTTDDIDSDGEIDQLTIVFSENVDIGDPGGAGDGLDCLNVVGYTIANGDHSGNDVPSLVVSLVESGSYDTDATPDVNYTQVNPSFIESVSTAQELAEGYTFNTTTDGASPVVRNVTSSDPDGTYTLTDLVVVVVEFSENVVVTGIPRIALNSGGIAYYSSGTGSDTLNFNYTVGAGQNSADLDYTAINALTLAGGTINDGVGNNAVPDLPNPGDPGSLGQNKNIDIDTPPRVTDVTSTNPNFPYYNAGTNIDINIVFSEIVSVTGGPPTLDLNSGGIALYSSGTDSDTLNFNYTVGAGQNSADLDYTGTGALNLNGGTIRDIDGAADDANLTLPVPGAAGSLGANKNLIIDTVPPQMLTAVFLDWDENDIDVGDYIIVGFDEPMKLNCFNSSDFVLLNSAFGDTFGTGSSLIDDVPDDNFINIVLGNNPSLNLTDIWSAPGLDMPSGLGIRSGSTLCATDLANNSAPDGPEIDISGGGFNVIETVTVSDGANIYTNPDASSVLLDVNISVTFDLQFVPSFIAVWYDVGADPDGVGGNPDDRMAIASGSGTSWTATIPASDLEIVEGVIVRFLTDVDGLRHYSDGSETSGGSIPWRFRIIYEQKDRVTIRNNIINPKNGEFAYINIVTSKSEKISVAVYDLNGDPVAELFKQKRMPGSNLITWDGKNRRGKIVVPGVYFIVVKVGGKRYVKKVLVVR